MEVVDEPQGHLAELLGALELDMTAPRVLASVGQLVLHLASATARLPRQGGARQQPLDARDQLLRRERLGNVVVRPARQPWSRASVSAAADTMMIGMSGSSGS